MTIRPATADDLAAIHAIHSHYVLRSAAIYMDEPLTEAQRRAWLADRRPEHPAIVADVDGEVVGFGALFAFRPYSGYRLTVENSVYVRPDAQGRGVGSALLADLIARARTLGHRAIVAVIDSEQPASLALHARHGFAEVGRLPGVGLKFGRSLDAVLMQLTLPGVTE